MAGSKRGKSTINTTANSTGCYALPTVITTGGFSAGEVPDQIAERFEQLPDRADRDRDDQLSELLIWGLCAFFVLNHEPAWWVLRNDHTRCDP